MSGIREGPSEGRGRGGAARRSLKSLGLRLALASLVLLAGLLTVAFIDANLRFAFLETGRPARIFSAPFVLAEGQAIERGDLEERLIRLGYQRVDGHPATPGEYSRKTRSFEIFLNSFDYPEGRFEAVPVRVRISFGRVASLENAVAGESLASLRLEPESIGVLSGEINEERVPTALDELPRVLRQAVVAVEDRRFDQHIGVDPRAILRALFANLRSGEVVQGGSTITQQLAKNLYPNAGDRTFARKIWETLAAFGLEAVRSKPAILERYLDQVYLAQRGPISIIGVGAASRHYFGKDARYLDLPESALLAGLIQSPGRYHPYRSPEAALERRNLVLRLMRDEGFIGAADYRAAAETPLRLRPEPPADVRQAPYFVDLVAEELKRLGIRDPAGRPGLRVFTTVDPLLQARAFLALDRSLQSFEKGYKHLRPLPGGAIQGALVALRPADGAIVAMAGGRSYAKSQFNRATQAHRQPGSLFKPFVYLAGFSKPEEGEESFTPATILDDSPLVMEVSGKVWEPHNFDEEYRGPVTARRALALSLNVPTIRAAEMIGLREVVRTARLCGITSALMPVPSIALGTFEVTPLEMAAAYATIATLGQRPELRAITAVVDDRGQTFEVPGPVSKEVLSPQAAYLTLDLMRDVVRYGTGAGIANYDIRGEFAGKTGTTDDGRDAWFVGFNPDLLALAWVGFDNNRPLRLGGSALALPVWAEFMSRAGLDPDRGWQRPEGLVEEEIDPMTGKLATWHCPDTENEIFIAGTEPREECEHGIQQNESWVSRFFNWFKR